MQPSLFNIHAVLQSVNTGTLSKVPSVPACPSCNSSSTTLTKSNILFCSDCGCVYDPVLYYDTVSGTNHLPTAIDKIIQNGGLTIKTNSKQIDEYLSSVCGFLDGANAIARESLSSMKSGKWLHSHGDLVRSLGVYYGTTNSGLEVVSKTMRMWTDFSVPKKSLALSSIAYPDSDKHQTAIVQLAWAQEGVCGLWFYTQEKATLYQASNKNIASAGFTFLNETAGYKQVLVVDDVVSVMKYQCHYFSKYRKFAPVIGYCGITSEDDWKLLEDKEKITVLLSHNNRSDAGSILPAVILDKSFVYSVESIPMALSSSTADVVVESAIRSSTSMFSLLCKMGPASLKAALKTLKSMPVEAFLLRSAKDHGESQVLRLGLGLPKAKPPTVVYNKESVELRNNGYFVVSSKVEERITNFTITLDRLLRYKEKDTVDYLCSIRVSDKVFPARLSSSLFSGKPQDLVNKVTSVLIDHGASYVPYINSKWANKLYDIMVLFSNSPSEVVVERPGWDDQVNEFIFPGVSIPKSGPAKDRGQFIVPECPLVKTPLTRELVDGIQSEPLKFVSVMSLYTVYALIVSSGIEVCEYKPLVIPSSSSMLGDTIRALLRNGIKGLEARRIALVDKTTIDSLSESIAVVEAPAAYAWQLAESGEAAAPMARFPNMILESTRKQLPAVFDAITLSFLEYALFHKKDKMSLEELETLFLEFARIRRIPVKGKLLADKETILKHSTRNDKDLSQEGIAKCANS